MHKNQIYKLGGFQFDARRGTWSLAAPGGRGAPALQNSGCRMQVNGRAYSLAQADSLAVDETGPVKAAGAKIRRLQVTARFRRPGFTWTLDFDVPEQGAMVRIGSAIRNDKDAALIMGDCDLLRLEHAAKGVLRLGGNPSEHRIFAFNGGLGTQRVKQITADGGDHQTAFMLHLHDPATQNAFLAGFVTFDRMKTLFTCRHDARRAYVDCAGGCRFQDFALKPGAAVRSESLRVELAGDPHAVLTHWADDVARQYRPRIWDKPPPVGWVGWAWVDKRAEIPEVQVANNLRAIKTRLADSVWITCG